MAMISQALYLLGSLGAFLITRLVTYLASNSYSSLLPLPPGPPRLPIIGNVHQVPKAHTILQYYAWSKIYGPVMHLNILGQSIIILSTTKAAHELLAKRED